MAGPTLHVDPGAPLAHIRARAVAEAGWLRGLATRALADGAPKAELRAANARAAARKVIAHARRMSALLERPDP